MTALGATEDILAGRKQQPLALGHTAKPSQDELHLGISPSTSFYHPVEDRTSKKWGQAPRRLLSLAWRRRLRYDGYQRGGSMLPGAKHLCLALIVLVSVAFALLLLYSI